MKIILNTLLSMSRLLFIFYGKLVQFNSHLVFYERTISYTCNLFQDSLLNDKLYFDKFYL